MINSQSEPQRKTPYNGCNYKLTKKLTKQFSVILIYFLLTIGQKLINSSEASNLPLLSASLRTFQAHACDGQQLILECLPNTVINIYLANYGRTAGSETSPHLCLSSIPSSSTPSSVIYSSSSRSSLPSLSSSLSPEDSNSPLNLSKMITLLGESSSPSSRSDPSRAINQTGNHSKPDCQTSDNLRYSLLHKVEGACREQRVCKIMTDPKSFGGIDPCPGIVKYAEVAYKCRPNTFYNKIVCEGNKMVLNCKKLHRIVIYSAFFGSTKTGVPECPQATSTSLTHSTINQEECSTSLTTEKVVASCGGLRSCEMTATRETFGNPSCSKSTRLHLKVVYACVRHEALKSSIGKSSTGKEITYPDELSGSSEKPSTLSVQTSSTPDYSGYMGAPRIIPGEEDDRLKLGMTPPSSSISSESYLKSKEPVKNPIRVPIQDGLSPNQHDNSDSYHSNNSEFLHPRKALGFLVDWLSAYNFIRDKYEMIAICLLLSIVAAVLLLFLFLSTNKMIAKRKNRKSGNNRIKKPNSPKGSPFSAIKPSSEAEILDDNTVDQLLEELNPVLVTSIDSDPLSGLNLTASHHSFHDFRVHSKPLLTDGLPFPANSGQTLSFTSSLSRGGNRLSFGRPVPLPTPMMTPPITPMVCETDSHPRAMSGMVNSYF